MKVLVACEFSGIVRDAFIRRGHDAISCDLLPTESPGPHIQGDVRKIIEKDWDLIIAHPPCTRLCLSGVRWLAERNLWNDMRESALFFRSFLEVDCPKIAVENPVMHKYALEIVGRSCDFRIQPWQFGHGETKKTCFWTKGLPVLLATNIVSGREHRIWKMFSRKDRGKKRSIFYRGIADAMAQQWGR